MLRDSKCGGICGCECVLVCRVYVYFLCLCECGLCSWWPNWWTMWHKMVASSIEQPSPHVPPRTSFSYETDWGSRACRLHTWAGQWAGHLVGFWFLKMFSLVHAETTSTTAKAITLGTILACMARLAEYLAFMLSTVGWVQQFVAHAAFETHLVPLQSSCHPLLGGIHRFAAFGALGIFHRLERHSDWRGLLSWPCRFVVG